MKALLYKEFRLAFHPICYVFVFVFPLMILIPKYPLGIGFIYILTCYPIIFLGANKGQQSNDLLYSTLQPVRKKDIVLARIITIAIMQFVYMALLAALMPLGQLVAKSLPPDPNNPLATLTVPGIERSGIVNLLAIGVVGFTLADLIFLPIYYKNGKSIVMSTLLTILGFVIYIILFTIVFCYIPGMEWYYEFMSFADLWMQFIVLAGALVIYVAVHFLVYKISARRLERVDF